MERRQRPTRPTRPQRDEYLEGIMKREPKVEPEVDRFGRQEESEETFDYENDLHIDPNYLDAEFLNHSQVFMKYAKASAQANKAAKLVEEKVKTIRSEVINRLKGTDAGKNATTLEAAYRLDPEYQAAKQEWIDATFKADLLSNAVFAFQARKTALENLVRLHGQEYFSTPNEPRDLPEAEERLKEIKESSATNAIKSRMRRER